MDATALFPKTTFTHVYTTATGTPTDCGTAVTVRLVSTTDCFVVIAGAATNATTSHMFLPAYAPEYIDTATSHGLGKVFVAAIGVTAGSLYITAMEQ